MPNFLEETLGFMKSHRLSESNIVFIGSDSGYFVEWPLFKAFANYEYHSLQANPVVASDLMIVFRDGTTMVRHDNKYNNGRPPEYWKITEIDEIPTKDKPIFNIFSMCPGGYRLLSQINP